MPLDVYIFVHHIFLAINNICDIRRCFKTGKAQAHIVITALNYLTTTEALSTTEALNPYAALLM